MRIVGIVAKATTNPLGYVPLSPQSEGEGHIIAQVVASADAILDAPYDWSALIPAQSSTGPEQAPGVWSLEWSYPMDFSPLSQDDGNTLLKDSEPDPALLGTFDGLPNTQNGLVDSNVFNAIASYRLRTISAQIVATIFLLDVIGLMCLFLNLMTSVLMERQNTTIAQFRSRGASRLQILAAFATQSIGLGLIACIAGPLLAIPLTRVVAGLLLPQQDQPGLDVLADNPAQLAARVGAFALVATGLMVCMMIWATYRASKEIILDLRRQATRSVHRPIWLRFHLDVLAAVLAFVGYGLFSLEQQIAGGQSSHTTDGSQLVAFFSLLAPMFLLVAGALLFLRCFPLLLRAGERLAARGRGLPAVLALTQLARSPRWAMQVTLLVALTVAFAAFTTITDASNTRYIQVAAAW